jgi:tRNA(adenine34) deaminase
MAENKKINPFSHEHFMRQALLEAQKAREADEVPIGAIVVLNDSIIGRGYNQTETLKDATAHAEMIALTAAFEKLGNKIIPEAKLYVTVEPCMMCSGALYWSRIQTIVVGTSDEKSGFLLQNAHPFFKKKEIITDILANECRALMQEFFISKRNSKI